jgi:DNA-binding IclR family transcriptional regulator
MHNALTNAFIKIGKSRVIMGEERIGKTQEKTNAIGKVCSVLKSLSVASPQRLNELAASTGINRATAFRILEDLVEEGIVEKKGSPPRYDFGPEIVAIAAASSRSWDVHGLVRPSLLRLADITGDTIVLHVRSHAESLCVDRVVGEFPIRANLLDVGARRPLGIGAGSMALLAWLPEPEQMAILDINCANLARFPNFNRAMLLEFISNSREQGYVFMCDVIVDTMGAMAIPIPDRHGAVRAAISIAALTDRLTRRRDELVEALRREAKIITRALKG